MDADSRIQRQLQIVAWGNILPGAIALIAAIWLSSAPIGARSPERPESYAAGIVLVAQGMGLLRRSRLARLWTAMGAGIGVPVSLLFAIAQYLEGRPFIRPFTDAWLNMASSIALMCLLSGWCLYQAVVLESLRMKRYFREPPWDKEDGYTALADAELDRPGFPVKLVEDQDSAQVKPSPDETKREDGLPPGTPSP